MTRKAVPDKADYESAWQKLRLLVDRDVGVIKSVHLTKLLEHEPNVFAAYADGTDTYPLAGIRGANNGAACATTPERALVRACGESVERYCSSFFDLDAMKVASEGELEQEGRRFLRVSQLYPFSEEQYQQPGFPYQPVHETTQLRWVAGEGYFTAEPVWVPASCVYVPYRFDKAVEPFTHMPISTGLAAGADVETCVMKGVMEILERDALMVIWQTQISARRVAVESCLGFDPDVDILLQHQRPGGPTWLINWLRVDIDIPIISAILIDSTDPPLTSFGIAADMDVVKAVRNAMEEAVLSRLLLNRSQEIGANATYSHERFRSLRDHLLGHATSSKLRKRLESIFKTGRLYEFDELIDECNSGTGWPDRLREAGLDPTYVDVTTEDVVDAGVRVVRTIIPKMQPLDNDHAYRHLGGARLVDVIANMGYPVSRTDSLNPDPHPFP